MGTAHEYPRPQLQRAEWTDLNGAWDFAFDLDGRWHSLAEVEWDTTITVPFSPETPASGIGNTGFFRACWYLRSFEAPALNPGERLMLHFGAVDDEATVWVNDQLAGRHEGGYTPFTLDITDHLHDGGLQTLTVRAFDDPHDLAKPRGKQDWHLEPHAIWYPRTTGIWQTVWLERLPATRISSLRWTCSVEDWEIGLQVGLDGVMRDDLRLSVQLRIGAGLDRTLLADDTYAVVSKETSRRIALVDPGIDDARNELLWSPESPTLIHARLRIWGQRGELVDEVESYTAMRSVDVQGDHFLFNGRPYRLRMALDQGYWLETGLTAPDDDALRRDVELAKAMGFNGVRKHQKVEDPRYLFWADTLGLLVWEEMPSAYRFSERSVQRVTRAWTEVIERDVSHPCIVAWVPLNESWGVPELPNNARHRDYVQALFHLTKALDGTRPVIGNDGWECTASDIIGVHDYEADPERLRERYGDWEDVAGLLSHERPGGRVLTLETYPYVGQPLMLTEFGGIAFASADDSKATWGYSRSATAEEFAERYAALLETVRNLDLFAGFCYTQFADTYQEANGLLTMDRTPKIPLDQIAQATHGPKSAREIERERREGG